MTIPCENNCVYKITNIKNNKSYIGISVNYQKRMREHFNRAIRGDCYYPLYKDMANTPKEDWHTEILINGLSREEACQKEIELIKSENTLYPNGYNITSGGENNSYDANPRATLTQEDVIQIRNRYESLESPTTVFQDYSDKISFSAFEKIWNGTTWVGINMDVYRDEIKEARQNVRGQLSKGSGNPNAIFTEEEVLIARKYYVNHTLKETYEELGEGYSSIDGFRVMLTRSYTNVPRYFKVEKVWKLNGEEIDIDNYNHVSTISGSGE